MLGTILQIELAHICICTYRASKSMFLCSTGRKRRWYSSPGLPCQPVRTRCQPIHRSMVAHEFVDHVRGLVVAGFLLWPSEDPGIWIQHFLTYHSRDDNRGQTWQPWTESPLQLHHLPGSRGSVLIWKSGKYCSKYFPESFRENSLAKLSGWFSTTILLKAFRWYFHFIPNKWTGWKLLRLFKFKAQTNQIY